MNDEIISIKNILTQYRSNGNVKSFPSTLRYSKDIVELLYDKKVIDDYDLYFLSKLYKMEKYSDIANSNIKKESILCIDNKDKLLLNLNYLNLQSLVSYIEDNGVYLDRPSIEFDSDVIQIIPYMMVIHNGKLLLLKKKKNKGDLRVADKIDFPAGHCSEENGGIINSILKELNEELGIDKRDIKKIDIIDTIPISENKFSVSHYHLGLVYLIELLDNVDIINNESDKHDIVYYEDLDSILDIMNYFGDWVLYGINTYNKYKGNSALL